MNAVEVNHEPDKANGMRSTQSDSYNVCFAPVSMVSAVFLYGIGNMKGNSVSLHPFFAICVADNLVTMSSLQGSARDIHIII